VIRSRIQAEVQKRLAVEAAGKSLRTVLPYGDLAGVDGATDSTPLIAGVIVPVTSSAHFPCPASP